MTLDDAKFHSGNAKNATVCADDVKLAIQYRADQSFTSQEIFYQILQSKKIKPFGHILYDSIYLKCQGQADPQRQKAAKWLLGIGAGEWAMTTQLNPI